MESELSGRDELEESVLLVGDVLPLLNVLGGQN
jgi:hypothetical protein